MQPQPPIPSTRRPARSRVPQSRAFTVIEFLVVVGVIALQAAFLFPALTRVRHTAHGAWCLNNLRQWGLATAGYATDHDGFLPPEGVPNPSDRDTNAGWYIQLPRQLGVAPYHGSRWRTNAVSDPGWSPFLCPANRRRSNGRNLFHYCLNQHVDGAGERDTHIRWTAVPQPDRVVWLFDSKNLPAVGSVGYAHTNLHGGGAQFLFLDGHARRFPADAFVDPVTRRGRKQGTELAWIP